MNPSALSPPSQIDAASSKLMPAGMWPIRALSAHADELCIRPEPAADAEDVVADRELADRWANRLDLPGQLGAQDSLLRSTQAGEEPPEERVGSTSVTVRPVDRRGTDPDQDFVLFGARPLDLLEAQDLRRAVPIVDDCPHAGFCLHDSYRISKL